MTKHSQHEHIPPPLRGPHENHIQQGGITVAQAEKRLLAYKTLMPDLVRQVVRNLLEAVHLGASAAALRISALAYHRAGVFEEALRLIESSEREQLRNRYYGNGE